MLIFVVVCVPPLCWLGVISIVLIFVLRATPWLARGYGYFFGFCLRAAPWLAGGYYYRFAMITECERLFFGVCV